MAKRKANKRRRQPAHQNRYALLANSFVRYLVRYLPGFKEEHKQTKLALASMIFQAPTRFRAHSHAEGYARFTYQELEGMFGRSQFNEINQRLRIFHIQQDELGRPDWSATEGRTKAYVLTETVKLLRDKYLAARTRRTPTALLTEAGDRLNTLPASALAAKNRATEQTRKGFKGLPVQVKVPVNIVQIQKLVKDIEARLYLHNARLPTTDEMFSPRPSVEFLRDLRNEALMMIALARNQRWPGHVLHRYFESASGRVYADGIPNLQSCYRVLREVAMSGMYDLDIENCHYTILDQMARQHGYECSAIRSYLDDKKKVRTTLEVKFGITEAQAKRALIALIYGARFSMRTMDALPKIFKSMSLATLVYENQLFRDLRDDIARARKAVLSAQTINRQTMKNCRGLTIDVTEADDRQQLAHLLQGVEVAALEAAYRLHGRDIVLLQHDGFTAKRQLDVGPIEAAMSEATGYLLKVKQERIQPNLERAFGDHPEGLKNQNDEPEIIQSNQSLTKFLPPQPAS